MLLLQTCNNWGNWLRYLHSANPCLFFTKLLIFREHHKPSFLFLSQNNKKWGKVCMRRTFGTLHNLLSGKRWIWYTVIISLRCHKVRIIWFEIQTFKTKTKSKEKSIKDVFVIVSYSTSWEFLYLCNTSIKGSPPFKALNIKK